MCYVGLSACVWGQGCVLSLGFSLFGVCALCSPQCMWCVLRALCVYGTSVRGCTMVCTVFSLQWVVGMISGNGSRPLCYSLTLLTSPRQEGGKVNGTPCSQLLKIISNSVHSALRKTISPRNQWCQPTYLKYSSTLNFSNILLVNIPKTKKQGGRE